MYNIICYSSVTVVKFSNVNGMIDTLIILGFEVLIMINSIRHFVLADAAYQLKLYLKFLTLQLGQIFSLFYHGKIKLFSNYVLFLSFSDVFKTFCPRKK